MTPGISAFSEELDWLSKEALAKGLAAKAVKHPLHALGIAAAVIPGLVAGARGYKRGRALGRSPRYLQASRRGPSAAFYGNFNQLMMRKKLPDRVIKNLSEHSRPEAYKR